MPELPEVEIVRLSLDKKIKKKSIKKVIIRNRNLRFKIPSDFESFLKETHTLALLEKAKKKLLKKHALWHPRSGQSHQHWPKGATKWSPKSSPNQFKRRPGPQNVP